MLWVALHLPRLPPGTLEHVAAWACQFTPRVSLEPPHGLLLEVEGSLRLFGGLERLLERLREGLDAMELTTQFAVAPAARAALWRSRGGGARLEELPLEVTGFDSGGFFRNIGISTVGELLKLPREGLSPRCGLLRRHAKPGAWGDCCARSLLRCRSPARWKRSGSRPAIFRRCTRALQGCSATRSPRTKAGGVSPSGCRRASAPTRSTAWRLIRIIVLNTAGGASSPANGIRASSGTPARARYGCSRRRARCAKTICSCSPAPSASSAAGGTATRRGATTSSPAFPILPWAGFTAKPAHGSCMACLPDYAELHCLSNFSFLRGASHAEELVERAAALGYSALAITDECSLAGAVRAHMAAKEHPELKLILGTEIRLQEGLKLVLLATDRRRSKKGS